MEQEIVIENFENLNLRNCKEEKNKFNENIEKLYEDKSIGVIISSTRKQIVKNVIAKIFICAESNDIYSFNKLYEEIVFINTKTFTKSEKETLAYCCDKIICKNYQDLNLLVKPFSLLNKVLKGKHTKLDWKIYYKIYFILAGHPCYEFSYMTPIQKEGFSKIQNFFSKCNKFFKMNEEDVKFIRDQIFRNLYSGSEPDMIYALKLIDVFYPKKSLQEDEELQKILSKIMVNKNHFALLVFLIFKKIIKFGLKNEKADFIDNFFNIMNNFITKGIYIGQALIQVKKAHKKNKHKTNEKSSFMKILAAFLFSDKFSEYRETIDRHFGVLINLINYNLKENSTKEIINFNLNFVKSLLSSSKEFTFKKQKKEDIKSDQFNDLEEEEKEYTLIEDKADRLKQIMKTNEPLIIKAMFYDENIAMGVLSEVQKLTNTFEIDKNILNTFFYIFENSDNNFISFINKFNSFLKVFLNNKNFLSNKEILSFLNNVINISIDKISSVSLDLNVSILTMFSNLYLIIDNLKKETLYKNSTQFSNFVQILNNSSILISKKIVGLFEMFSASKKSENIQLFIMSAVQFVNEEAIEKMGQIFVNYAEDNIIGKADIAFYFKCIFEIKGRGKNGSSNSNKSKLLWEFCYKNLLRKEKEKEILNNVNTTSTTSLFNYKPTENYQIDIFNDKKLKHIKKILMNILYNEIASSETFKIELFNLLSILLTQSDTKYHKLAFATISRVIMRKLTPYTINTLNEKNVPVFLIKYPNEEDVSLILDLFNKFVSPFHENLKNMINTINQNFSSYLEEQTLNHNLNEKEKKKLVKKWMKTQKSEEINSKEKIVLTFIRLETCFTTNIDNIYILKSQKEFPLYDKIKEIRTSLKQFHLELYTSFLSLYGLHNRNINIHKFYLRNILFQMYDNSSNVLCQTNRNSKTFSKLLKNLAKKEKPILNYFKLVESYVAHLRLFKISQDDKILPENMKLAAKLFINSTDKKINSFIGDYLKNCFLFICNNLKRKELRKLYEEIYKFYLKTIEKIKTENNVILISDKMKIINIFNFYTYLVKFFNLAESSSKIDIVINSINLLTKATEKKYNEILITSKILFSVLVKIKFELPKNYFLIQKKLKNFPFLNNMEEKHENIITKKLEKLAKNSDEKITKKSLKTENCKNKLITQIKKFFNEYHEKLISNQNIENTNVNNMINIYVLLALIFTLNLTQKEDFSILSKYEQYFYKDILSDSTYIQKRISFIFFGLILRIKHKISKETLITQISDEEYLNNKNDIIIERKDSISGLSPCNVKYIKTTRLIKNEDFAGIDKAIISSLNSYSQESDSGDFNKLINSLIFLKDSINDQSLMKSGAGSNNLLSMLGGNGASGNSFDFLDIFLNYMQNPHNKNKISTVFFAESLVTQNLFDAWESKIFFHMFHLYGLSSTLDYDKIVSLFDKKINEANKEKLIPLSVFLHVSSGLIKNDIKSKNYSSISKNMFRVMDYYTNNINKRIDSDILKYFSFIIENLSIKDFRNIFFTDGNFVLFNFDSDFILKFLNIITKHFGLKSSYIFISDNILNKVDNIIDIYLSDREKLVKNLLGLKLSISSLLLLSNAVLYNFNEFEFYFEKTKCKNYFTKLINISKATEIKEMKQLCSYVVFMYKRYFIYEPDLLIEYLIEISKVTYLDIEDFERHLNILRQTFQFPCYKIKISDYLNHIESKLNTLDNLHSRKFFVDLLTNLFRSNLNNYNTTENYEESLNCIFNMIKNAQYEIKDYIVNNLLIYFIHSLDNEVNNKIIENLKIELTNTSASNNISLSIIFILGTYLKSFDLEVPENIQNLIVFLKENNNKIFKNRGAESKLIKSLIADFFNKYKYTYNYAKRTMSSNCNDAILELSRAKSYFL